jgi:hypothetical protein
MNHYFPQMIFNYTRHLMTIDEEIHNLIMKQAPVGLNIGMIIFGRYDGLYSKDSKGEIQRN